MTEESTMHDLGKRVRALRLDTVRAYGEAVIALRRFSGHARASGVEMTGGIFEVFRFKAGQIARIEDFTDRSEALKAVRPEE